MLKKDKVYYENLYLAHLYNLKTARTEEEFNDAMIRIMEFRNKGLRGSLDDEILSDTNELSGSEYSDIKNRKNYKKFISNNKEEIDLLLDETVTADDEIERINRVKSNRKFKKAVVVGLLVAALALGVHACNKNKKSKTINETTYGTTTTLGTSEPTTTIEATTSETSTVSTGDYDSDKAIPSMSERMSNISINDGTSATTSNTSNTTKGTTKGTTTDETTKKNNGGSGSPVVTTKGTEGTTKGTTKATESTTKGTTRDDSIPTTTSPTTTKNNDDDRKKRNVENDEYDGKQPSSIEEKPGQTHPTYTTFETTKGTTKATEGTTKGTTKATEGTTKATTKETYKGKPVETKPNQTYQTFFTFETEAKSNSEAKKLTLSK